jgi:AcrR family transcriptional regulator
MSETTVQRRPGGRTARVRAAVLKAALQELAAGGYASFGFEGVARRAGVHKTTLYRRWGSRENLLLEALLELGRERVPIPDTGSLRSDLIEYASEVVASATTPEVEAVVRAVASIGDKDPRLGEAGRRYWRARIELAGEMVDRAAARREIPPGTDPGLIVESVLGPIYFRLLLSREPLDAGFIEALVDLAIP